VHTAQARRRATGTEPHSQTGIAKPASAAAGTWAGAGSVARRANARAGTNTAIAADAVAPIRMNGRASTTIDVKITPKVPITSLSATPPARARTIAPTVVQNAAAKAQTGTTGAARSSLAAADAARAISAARTRVPDQRVTGRSPRSAASPRPPPPRPPARS
jgi:hypothetical protein